MKFEPRATNFMLWLLREHLGDLRSNLLVHATLAWVRWMHDTLVCCKTILQDRCHIGNNLYKGLSTCGRCFLLMAPHLVQATQGWRFPCWSSICFLSPPCIWIISIESVSVSTSASLIVSIGASDDGKCANIVAVLLFCCRNTRPLPVADGMRKHDNNKRRRNLSIFCILRKYWY